MALRPTRFESSYPIGETVNHAGSQPNKAQIELVELPSADGGNWAAATRVVVQNLSPLAAMGELSLSLRRLADAIDADHQAMEGFYAMATVEAAKAAAPAPKQKR
jgi:hypothetical protein